MNDSSQHEGIAVIGMVGRFPGAGSVDEFWKNLRDGVESISFFSDEEVLSAGVHPALLNVARYVKARGSIEDVEMFDARFFGYSPREAEIMDPQHRLFLECAWEALEAAGCDPETYQGRIGVYGGMSANSYLFYNLLSNPEILASSGGFQTLIGNDKDHLATRVSYKLNLKGPSLTVQTTCSTSLVAVHLACQSLLSYQSDMALAGGVSISIPQKTGYLYQEGGVASPDGHCRAFDAGAKGTVSGNGVGIAVLKRLDEALADRDVIYAVIKGSAINNDGADKVGYTAPSIEGQAAVITEAQALAGIDPSTISYIEAHGTGTPLGDPIEVSALTRAFQAGTQGTGFCAIGSVKSNIGHLDAAAGVAGLIKTVLALKHGMIPPSLYFTEPNPHIDFANSPFHVNARLKEWSSNGTPRRAGVSSFGIGGTNAHVVIEEAPAVEQSSPSPRDWQVLVLSAKTALALERATDNLADYLKLHREAKLEDVAFTLAVGRRGFSHRRVVVCRDLEQAAAALESRETATVATAVAEEARRSVVFMFAGQGTQYVGMGRELYETEAVFRAEVDRCSEVLKNDLGLDLRDVLYPSQERRQDADEKLKQTRFTQPALFVFEYALAQQMMAWGVQPAAMIGHSIGEYVAACLAKVFTLEDALRIVAARGRLMNGLPAGAMLALTMSEPQLSSLLRPYPDLSVAAVNGEEQCVVSGPFEVIADFEQELGKQGVLSKRLETSHAFHSAMMDPVLDEFRHVVNMARLQSPQIRWISNVTGKWISAEEATDAGYWARHLRQTVRFGDGLRELLKDDQRVLLEVGPGQTLGRLAKRCRQKSAGAVIVSSLNHAPQPQSSRQSERWMLSNAVGLLWLSGVEIDWSRFYSGERRQRVALPTYPFERERYWVERRAVTAAEDHGSLDRQADVADWFYVPTWKRTIPPELLPCVKKEDDGCWLVFTSERGVGPLLVKQLKAAGHEVVSVLANGKGEKELVPLGEGAYSIDGDRREHFQKLLAEVRAQSQRVNKVVHLWGIDQRPGGNRREATCGASVNGYQAVSSNSLLTLARTLDEDQMGANGNAGELEIVIVTAGVQEVTGRQQTWPEKATVLGMSKIIGHEYEKITCRTVDIEHGRQSGPTGELELIGRLVAELNLRKPESTVAYRGNHRWVQDFEPARIEEMEVEPAVEDRQSGLRNRGGVYLISAEMEDAGCEVARYIASNAPGVRLALTGPAEPAGRFDSRKIEALEKMGAEVIVVGADPVVDVEQQMRMTIEGVRKRWGSINGVIHITTRERENTTIRDMKPCEYTRLLQSRVGALLLLDEALKGDDLDFRLVLSSSASILGSAGSVTDSALGQFANAFAYKQNKAEQRRWLSVTWDLGQSRPEQSEESEAISAGPEITLEEGGEILRRLFLINALTQVVVSPVNLPARIRRQSERKRVADDDNANKEDSPSLHSRPDLRSNYVAPRTQAEETVAKIVGGLLGVEKVGIHDDFFDLGGHSLAGIQLVFSLRDAFDTEELHLNSLFEHPTVAGLAVCIEQARRMELHTPNILVPMQTEGTKPPFFCVHPIGGDVFGLVDLARHMAPDYPFYGIQAAGLAEVARFGNYGTMQEIAAEYIDAIRYISPEGPYLLGGFSYGGIVAFEMAHQLKARGEQVAFLAMLDTPAPATVAKVALLDDAALLLDLARERARQHDSELDINLEDIQSQDPDKQLSFIVETLKAANLAPADLDEDWLRNFIRGFRVRLNTTVNYVPRVYPGRITLFRASQRDPEMKVSMDKVKIDYSDPNLGWDKVSAETIDVRPVEGFHEMIVRGRYSLGLAEELKACIDKSLIDISSEKIVIEELTLIA